MQKDANLVELEKCCQTHIFLQNFVLIQPRTSPLKICKILKFVEQLKPDAIPGYDFSINPVRSNFEGGLGTLTSNPGGVRPNDYGLQMSKPPGFLGLATDYFNFDNLESLLTLTIMPPFFWLPKGTKTCNPATGICSRFSGQ